MCWSPMDSTLYDHFEQKKNKLRLPNDILAHVHAAELARFHSVQLHEIHSNQVENYCSYYFASDIIRNQDAGRALSESLRIELKPRSELAGGEYGKQR